MTGNRLINGQDQAIFTSTRTLLGECRSMSKLFAESFGTFWLVFSGCGSALFAAGVADVGIGYVGVSLASRPNMTKADCLSGHRTTLRLSMPVSPIPSALAR